jgi:hypothetical protein
MQMHRLYSALIIFVFAIVALMERDSFAQPKPSYAPSSTHIFPAGGKRGTTVAVRVGADSEGVSLASPTLDRLHLTVQHKSVFKLSCSEHYQYAHRGTVYAYLMDIERLDGFDGQVTLQIGDRQNRDLDGIEMIETVVPPGQLQATMPIYLPETMHINVQSQSQLYTQGFATFTDQFGQQQSLLVLSEKRNMLRSMPPVVKLKAVEPQITATPGGTAICRLRLERTSNFDGPMRIELVDAESSLALAADKVSFGSGQSEVEVAIRISDAMPSGAECTLKFRATGHLNSNIVVISEGTVRLRVR